VRVPGGVAVGVRVGALVGVRVGRAVRVAVAVGLGVRVRAALLVAPAVWVWVVRRSRVLVRSIDGAGRAQPVSEHSRDRQIARRTWRAVGEESLNMVMKLLYIKKAAVLFRIAFQSFCFYRRTQKNELKNSQDHVKWSNQIQWD